MQDSPHSARDHVPTVDITAAARFLKLLDPDATSFTFQTVDDDRDRNRPQLRRVLHGNLDQHVAILTRLNNKGAGVFVTVNETDLKGRKAENVVQIRAVFLDLDGSPLQPVLENQVQPHIVVETSAGKFHAYWRVKDLPLDDFQGVQQAIANRYQGDSSVCDLPRVMRLPGFYHRKREPFRVRIYSSIETPPYPASYFERPPAEPHRSGDKEEVTTREIILATAALEVLPPAMEWKNRNYIGMATWRATDGHDEGLEAWCRWLERSGRFNERAARRQWKRYCKSKPVKLGLGTLIFLADVADPEWREKLVELWGVS
ncbi:DNA-primase RepB domain-containing protein [Bradyrhizobium sp. URHC0002]